MPHINAVSLAPSLLKTNTLYGNPKPNACMLHPDARAFTFMIYIWTGVHIHIYLIGRGTGAIQFQCSEVVPCSAEPCLCRNTREHPASAGGDVREFREPASAARRRDIIELGNYGTAAHRPMTRLTWRSPHCRLELQQVPTAYNYMNTCGL